MSQRLTEKYRRPIRLDDHSLANRCVGPVFLMYAPSNVRSVVDRDRVLQCTTGGSTCLSAFPLDPPYYFENLAGHPGILLHALCASTLWSLTSSVFKYLLFVFFSPLPSHLVPHCSRFFSSTVCLIGHNAFGGVSSSSSPSLLGQKIIKTSPTSKRRGSRLFLRQYLSRRISLTSLFLICLAVLAIPITR